MHMLICTIGSKQRKSTLQFAQEVARALSAEVTLLGINRRKASTEPLEQLLDKQGAFCRGHIAGHKPPEGEY